MKKQFTRKLVVGLTMFIFISFSSISILFAGGGKEEKPAVEEKKVEKKAVKRK